MERLCIEIKNKTRVQTENGNTNKVEVGYAVSASANVALFRLEFFALTRCAVRYVTSQMGVSILRLSRVLNTMDGILYPLMSKKRILLKSYIDTSLHACISMSKKMASAAVSFRMFCQVVPQ